MVKGFFLNKTVSLNIDIKRFDEHDEKVFLDLLAMLPQNSCVNWYFEDEDQEENGEYFAENFYTLFTWFINQQPISIEQIKCIS